MKQEPSHMEEIGATPPITPQKISMPASHKWAAICFFFTAGVNLFLNFHGAWDVLGLLVTITSLAGFIGILFFRRSPRTYTVSIIGLLFFVLRASQSMLSGVWWLLRGEEDANWISWFSIGLSCFLYVLILLLFRAYVFGAASRQYYGFPSVPVRRVRIDPFDAPGEEPSSKVRITDW